MKKFLKTLKSEIQRDPGGAIVALVLLVLIGFVGNAFVNDVKKPSDNQLARTSVKIVRSDKRSGGSGVILSSSAHQSTVLTNNHVCGVVEKGGLVIRDGEEHAVVSYYRSDLHDLCLITVAADLGVNTEIADKAPALNTPAIVVGHPHLSPTMITRGHFSSHEIVEVMTHVRKCTDDDISADPDNVMLCVFLGGIPVITRYEAQATTALIQPGSSGSPVFNTEGKISGLVFAGSGDLGYGLIVPYESVAMFLRDERVQKNLPVNSYDLNAQAIKGQGTKRAMGESIRERVQSMCSDPNAITKEAVKRICAIASKDVIWRN